MIVCWPQTVFYVLYFLFFFFFQVSDKGTFIVTRLNFQGDLKGKVLSKVSSILGCPRIF